MESEWFTDFLDSGASAAVPASACPPAADPAENRPGSKRSHANASTYITPPSMRKAAAVPAVSAAAVPSGGRATVMAIKVVEPAAGAKPELPAATAQPAVKAEFPAATATAYQNVQWSVGAAAPPKRDRRKVSRKNPSPTSFDGGYASSEGGSPPVKPQGAVPAMNMASLRETLETVPDAAADMSDFFSEEMSEELIAFSRPVRAGACRAGKPDAQAGASSGRVRRPPRRNNSSASLSEMSEPVAPPPSSSSALALAADDLTEPELDSALPATDGARRKVRHNLTERRRVDRMNQLFHRLAMTIIEEEAAPAITMSGMDASERTLTQDGKEIAKPKWSKADVLEGAIAVVNDLREQLAQERLARSLGVPVSAEGDFPDDDGGMDELGEEGDDDDADGERFEVALARYPTDSLLTPSVMPSFSALTCD